MCCICCCDFYLPCNKLLLCVRTLQIVHFHFQSRIMVIYCTFLWISHKARCVCMCVCVRLFVCTGTLTRSVGSSHSSDCIVDFQDRYSNIFPLFSVQFDTFHSTLVSIPFPCIPFIWTKVVLFFQIGIPCLLSNFSCDHQYSIILYCWWVTRLSKVLNLKVKKLEGRGGSTARTTSMAWLRWWVSRGLVCNCIHYCSGIENWSEHKQKEKNCLGAKATNAPCRNTCNVEHFGD